MHCQICGTEAHSTIGESRAWRAVARASADERRRILELGEAFGWTENFEFVRCTQCRFIWVEPMPDAAVLERFYDQYYGTGSYFAKADKKIRRFYRRIVRLKRHVAGREFVDVGCNVGFAVEAARRAGFSATGFDVDKDTVALAAQQFPAATFHAIDIAGFAAAGRQFDLAHCSEVIEHVREVRPFARALAALVKPGGLLYLTTPDAGHWRVPRRFVEWPEAKPPEHICWFSRPNLRLLLGQAGFRVERFAVNLKPGLKVLARKLPPNPADRSPQGPTASDPAR